ncbi:alpha-amylase family glycosyl hydrolase [Streptomyces sp. NBC_00659]|uniref:alpha-amylase family glycosyl hydrolase n=1 Tax=Streptomyces sp. NBC_00659 TaxID=2903669 RepID=UPI003FCDD49E
MYQSEELGLYEVEGLPDAALQDLTWERSGHTVRGRDGCRVPLPWTGDTPPFGFSTTVSATPWLPQPHDWKFYTAEANQADRTSMLRLYRSALRLHRTNPGLCGEDFRWLDSPAGTLLFERGNGLPCAVNLTDQPTPLPAATSPLIASGPLTKDGLLPLRRHGPAAPVLTNERDRASPRPTSRAPSRAHVRQGLSGVPPRRSDRPWPSCRSRCPSGAAARLGQFSVGAVSLASRTRQICRRRTGERLPGTPPVPPASGWPQPWPCRRRAEQNRSQRLRIHAGQKGISRHGPAWRQTHEQRIQSIQAKLTPRHPK